MKKGGAVETGVQKEACAHLDRIACPVMSALVKRGLLNLDGDGRATQMETFRGLSATGNSPEMASFQAKGIAAFTSDDKHQEYRERTGSYDGTLYLNYDTWNPMSDCSNGPTVEGTGRPCNANVGFQQHGYSTTVRDPTDGTSAEARWRQWFEQDGILVNDSSVGQRVMTMNGMGRLLRSIRINGDKSGEFSLRNAWNLFSGSNLQYYHPSADRRVQQLMCSQWQAVGAWAAFWAVWARYGSDGSSYMTEDDLKGFFLNADFPADWTPQPWGFKESFKVVRELRGTGAGDEWAEAITGILRQFGDDATETEYLHGLLQALTSAGARNDDIFKKGP